MEHHVTVGARREWWSSEWQLSTLDDRCERPGANLENPSTSSRAAESSRLAAGMDGRGDERRRRTCERQVFHRKVLRSNRVSPVAVLYRAQRARQRSSPGDCGFSLGCARRGTSDRFLIEPRLLLFVYYVQYSSVHAAQSRTPCRVSFSLLEISY